MSNTFDFLSTPLAGLFEIQRKQLTDERGFLSRLFCSNEFNEIGHKSPFVQVNQTSTRKKGTVRGMHFQFLPYAESKLITCIKGEVFDVAVDIREDSKTFLQCHSVVLSESNLKGLYVPEGFAHGFQTLTDDCQLIYLHSNFYNSSFEGALNPFDSRLGIKWPLEVTKISERDASHPMIDTKFKGILTS
jgi:dTDP-4-dehydrorhamnose 3,5-epimerase